MPPTDSTVAHVRANPFPFIPCIGLHDQKRKSAQEDDTASRVVLSKTVNPGLFVAVTIGSLLASAERGDATAADALFTALYSELHRLAGRQLAGRSNLTLGTTTLLHEAYLNMSRQGGVDFPDRARFMAYAARVMRRL